MNKFNQMFVLRNKNEYKKLYKDYSIYAPLLALALVVIALFVEFYNTITVSGFLAQSSIDTTIFLIMIIVGLVIPIICLALDVVFKNSPKISILIVAISVISLFVSIFAYIYYANNPDGIAINNFGFALGSLFYILSAVLNMGNEFYKMGWQGYDSKSDEEAAIQLGKVTNEQVTADSIPEKQEVKEEIDEQK